jgi:hypothetical protein
MHTHPSPEEHETLIGAPDFLHQSNDQPDDQAKSAQIDGEFSKPSSIIIPLPVTNMALYVP